MSSPLLGFPVDTISAMIVGLIAYHWAVRTGFRTHELAEIEDQCLRLMAGETNDPSRESVATTAQ